MKSKNQSDYDQTVRILETEILEMKYLLAITNTGMTCGAVVGGGAADIGWKKRSLEVRR